MKKKIVGIVMATAMCVSLAGCGNQSATGTATASGTDNAEAAGEEPYEATVMYWAANDARDVQHVEDAINELSIPRNQCGNTFTACDYRNLYAADSDGFVLRQ